LEWLQVKVVNNSNSDFIDFVVVEKELEGFDMA
jgi:hypothetical protein